jgi:hypothetical protein
MVQEKKNLSIKKVLESHSQLSESCAIDDDELLKSNLIA